MNVWQRQNLSPRQERNGQGLKFLFFGPRVRYDEYIFFNKKFLQSFWNPGGSFHVPFENLDSELLQLLQTDGNGRDIWHLSLSTLSINSVKAYDLEKSSPFSLSCWQNASPTREKAATIMCWKPIFFTWKVDQMPSTYLNIINLVQSKIASPHCTWYFPLVFNTMTSKLTHSALSKGIVQNE